jgi:hypothetical protein
VATYLQAILDAAEEFVLEVPLLLLEHGLLAFPDAATHREVLGKLVIIGNDVLVNGSRQGLPAPGARYLNELVRLLDGPEGRPGGLPLVELSAPPAAADGILLEARDLYSMRRRAVADGPLVRGLERLLAVLEQHPRALSITARLPILAYKFADREPRTRVHAHQLRSSKSDFSQPSVGVARGAGRRGGRRRIRRVTLGERTVALLRDVARPRGGARGGEGEGRVCCVSGANLINVR